jgi:hypothetical protein
MAGFLYNGGLLKGVFLLFQPDIRNKRQRLVVVGKSLENPQLGAMVIPCVKFNRHIDTDPSGPIKCFTKVGNAGDCPFYC